jgi:hypothetical protein
MSPGLSMDVPCNIFPSLLHKFSIPPLQHHRIQLPYVHGLKHLNYANKMERPRLQCEATNQKEKQEIEID